ncbi:MAG: FAD-dependent oxidoreductase [Chromatiales bacterium]
MGIGVDPDLGFIPGSGIKLDHGVLVNQYLETSHTGIYAAGDVACFFDPVFRRYRRVEHCEDPILSQPIFCLDNGEYFTVLYSS